MLKEAKLKYLKSDLDRHGNRRIYVRRPGAPKIRLRAAPGTPEFLDEYCLALRGERPANPNVRPPGRRIKQGTLDWLVAEYLRSAQFKSLGNIQQRTRRGILLACCDELLDPEKLPDRLGECPLPEFTPVVVRAIRDRKAKVGLYGAANNRKKALSSVYEWAKEEGVGGVMTNPCREVARAKPKGNAKSRGFHTWTLDEVRQFEARHPVGTKPRLAMALMLFTGARRGDAVGLGRQHIGKDGWLNYRPAKTANSSGKKVEIPVLPVLRQIIDATPCGNLTFLVTQYGKPFTANGFGNWFRERCDEAGLPHCTAHGLRKAGATIAADNGATPHQLMAIFGWTTLEQAEVYTREVNRKRLAGEGMKHILPTK